MLTVGLTGGIASGKSSVVKLLKQHGAKSIDSDVLVHQHLRQGTPVWKKVVRQFGKDVLTNSKNISRKKLAKIVFNHPRKLRQLEQIVHPPVIADLKKWLKSWNKKKHISLVVAEVPLLFEKKLESLFDVVVVVTASKKEQISRCLKKGYSSQQEVLKRINSQMNLRDKAQKADFVVRNNGTEKDLKLKVNQLLKKLNR